MHKRWSNSRWSAAARGAECGKQLSGFRDCSRSLCFDSLRNGWIARHLLSNANGDSQPRKAVLQCVLTLEDGLFLQDRVDQRGTCQARQQC
eukprot:CAMPEP_0172755198 /NCGR_PEP_ID=MMETSP1074-20121228/159409_1 /TAXON_ID=2916 /ORGANISM="Ceratium fusus, Strain PA161109" /LENGTH=90 /DNA_ID=CAMNT_0013588253 /DNA_START=47 /DNA_END=319 /DNA_ORIENTATION=-